MSKEAEPETGKTTAGTRKDTNQAKGTEPRGREHGGFGETAVPKKGDKDGGFGKAVLRGAVKPARLQSRML
jgi:hypothetical protein